MAVAHLEAHPNAHAGGDSDHVLAARRRLVRVRVRARARVSDPNPN